ncbi:peptidoglycan editing factor PgeF [Leptolyngbya sp. FACHB-711]|uniref:peptidoglycan editing factor PgeF n=1 Tax=unclassified Leptolyngbya TaxID=2650499 RepID=UPI0016898259|nr:peptidoglycan editing factor PgeF [Leptolyngbya sp. FACHB-711]MBD1851403.1 peptidoglycan editing factor PgeF [Cyanobacteria bacterium FACHB-502]MBD2023301.1 peptidoglycan editing factor PgeF [Leptolyngbya sp. FACHB-711]
MHTWHWQTWQDLPYLTCSLLRDWSHGFFTQQFWVHAPEDLAEVLQPTAQVYRVKQVHSNTVLTAAEIDRTFSDDAPLETVAESDSAMFPEADGIVSDDADQAVWVCTADCTPVLIADAETGQVAAIHAGWRGTATQIVPRAIERLQQQGSQLQNLKIALGPAIAGEVYQVSLPVAAQIGSTIVSPESSAGESPEAEVESLLNALSQIPDSPLLPDPQPGRARIDVRRTIALQLEQLGIASDQVSIAPYCTYQTPEYFFSYRRERLKRVQWSGIVSA